MSIRSIGNSCLNMIFGNGNDIVIQSIRHSIKNRHSHHQTYTKALFKGTCDGFVRSHLKNKKNGGFFTSLKQNINDIGREFKNNDFSFNGLWKTAGTVGRILPIAFATLNLIQDVPNIIKATKEKGLKQGIKETTKTLAKLVTASVFSIFPTALIRIPILSNTYGYFIGEQLGSEIGDKLADIIVGKSYTDKIKEIEKKQKRLEKLQKKQNIKLENIEIDQINNSEKINFELNKLLRRKKLIASNNYQDTNYSLAVPNKESLDISA